MILYVFHMVLYVFHVILYVFHLILYGFYVGVLGGKVKVIETSLWRNTAAKLREHCIRRGLPIAGSKAVLIQRICVDIHGNLARMEQVS